MKIMAWIMKAVITNINMNSVMVYENVVNNMANNNNDRNNNR